METLTKENFWNEMEQKYPKAMEHFQNWIDGYKNYHNWDKLFNSGHYIHDDKLPNWVSKAPKYHELPIAMQFGIFVEYSLSCMTIINRGDTLYKGFQFYTNDLKKEFRQAVDQVFTIVTFDILKEDHP